MQNSKQNGVFHERESLSRSFSDIHAVYYSPRSRAISSRKCPFYHLCGHDHVIISNDCDYYDDYNALIQWNLWLGDLFTKLFQFNE